MRRRTRRKRKNQNVSHERWLVSYADFITLMFAFFVVLYSSGQVDKRKAGQLATAIQTAFQQMGIFDSSNSNLGLVNTEPMPIADAQIVENVRRLRAMGALDISPLASAAAALERSKMNKMQKDLETSLAAQIQDRTVSVTPTKEGIVVSLREAGFFHSGSTALSPQAIPTLNGIVKLISPGEMRIRIEGHTDIVPIHNQKYDSNWELSTARATEIIKLFITKYALAPNRLSASGYGEYYPVASNETEEGRAMNRRVDLVILNSNAGPSRAPAPSPPEKPVIPAPPVVIPPADLVGSTSP